MTVSCPRGHLSQTTDYCDQCGAPIDASSDAPGADASGVVSAEVSSATQRRAEPPPAAERCPRCQTARVSGDRFCEVDGYDFDASPTSAGTWIAVVTADRARFELLSPDGIEFPDHAATWTFALETDTITVGRRSEARGIHPDLDLSGPPEDPGISREHLRLERTPDGHFAVVDCGSTNGTTLNDDVTSIPAGTPVDLAETDRIHLGAWTTIVVCRDDGASPGSA